MTGNHFIKTLSWLVFAAVQLVLAGTVASDMSWWKVQFPLFVSGLTATTVPLFHLVHRLLGKEKAFTFRSQVVYWSILTLVIVVFIGRGGYLWGITTYDITTFLYEYQQLFQ